MRRNGYIAENFRTCAYIHVPLDFRRALAPARSDGDLLKDQTIDADDGVGRNNDTVRVRDQKSAADLTTERNVCSRNDAPKTMAQNANLANEPGEGAARLRCPLVGPDRKQELAARIVESLRLLPRPIGYFSADFTRCTVGHVGSNSCRPRQ